MTKNNFTPYSDSSLCLGAPNYATIDQSCFVDDTKAAIELALKRVEAIKNNPDPADFDNTIMALETCAPEFDKVIGVFSHLEGANTNDDIEKMAQEIDPMGAHFSNQILLDSDLFARVDAVYQSRETLGLDFQQMAVLEKTWKGFKRNGAGLNDEAKARLRDIDAKMAQQTTEFANNARKSAQSFELVITDEALLSGLPEMAIKGARQMAEDKGYGDGWLFNLDYPSYIPFVTYADNRELREKMWRAHRNTALGGEFDNQDLIKSIIALRHERAQILGFKTHADYVLDDRMAQNFETVDAFLNRLEDAARPLAEKDLDALKNYAAQQGQSDPVKPWDVAYWAEKLKQKTFDFDEEQLRPYFQIDRVIDGLFDHAQKLFGITLKQLNDVPLYADDVRTYRVEDSDGSVRGLLYADFYPREGKRQGAWQSTIRSRQTNEKGDLELPLVNIVMNFTKPTKDHPSLLSFDEVETLYHEFGHALHSLLTDMNYGAISGTSVKWDFVELPSQIMENWLVEPDTLNSFARHYETDEPIPADLIKGLRDSQAYMKAWFMMRQLMLGRIDFAWHTHNAPGQITDVVSFEKSVADRFSFLPDEGGCTSTGFGHIFAGGYSAGYYSYLWAAVLDADAFQAFKQNGLYDAQTGQLFRQHILSMGGSKPPMDLFVAFRGHEPDPTALMRRYGLLDETKQAA